eukprot:4498750-Pyramimonas_sp.AAC.1
MEIVALVRSACAMGISSSSVALLSPRSTGCCSGLRAQLPATTPRLSARLHACMRVYLRLFGGSVLTGRPAVVIVR